MNKITKQVLEKYLDENGKIYLPDFCERVLFDIGTSYNAPHSQVWTKETKDVCVFAFEPNPFNIECLNEGRWLKSSWQHPLQLNPEVLDEKVFLINAALLDGNPKYVDFYCAEEDPGTSSVYEPTYIKVSEKIKVPAIRLKDFFDVFPWGKISFIEHIKIDAQSADFDIVKGMGEYIKKVLYLTVECNTIDNDDIHQYKNPNENPSAMREYIESFGFECKRWNVNGVFYNKNMIDLWDEYEYYFLEEN